MTFNRLEGTHSVYFSITIYTVNQKYMSIRTDSNYKLQGLHVRQGEIQHSICILCDFMFTSQMVLLFKINI